MPTDRAAASMLRTLFLNPPSFEGFDGGAGSRYQARREVKSFYYPTWLAQPAALVPGSRLVDAPARGLSLDDILPLASEYELVIVHTSTPSFANDIRIASALRDANSRLRVGFVGAHVAVAPEDALRASAAIDFVAGNEFDFTVAEVARGRPLAAIEGLSYRSGDRVVHNPARPLLEDMDRLPHVVDVYARDLVIEDYYNGYLFHPYVSFHTGRGCKSRCTFCLWPQTIAGHRYRTRSPTNVLEEVAKAQRHFPKVKEVFFDDDTFTDAPERAVKIARGMGDLGVTWSCNAKANVSDDTLKRLRDGGLRLVVVGFESGNQQILHNIKKGMRIEWAHQFSEACHKLGIKMHGTFIVGLPGETRETIQESIRFAKEINPHTIQVSVAAAYPGTFLHQQAVENGWLLGAQGLDRLVSESGTQISSIAYPHLSHEEIFEAASEFYRRFYFQPRKIWELTSSMMRSRHEAARRLREGVEFFRFLATRTDAS